MPPQAYPHERLRSSAAAAGSLPRMTFAAAIILIAAGAIVRYALTIQSSVVNLDTLGLILMIVGFAGLVLAFVQELIWTDRAKNRGDDPRNPPR
jgi:hypothetical protein